MLPLRDDVPSKTTPWVNYLLILANAAVFWHELTLGRHLDGFVRAYALIPARLEPVSFLTSMFLHGGWMHVLSNMWCLWIFGDNVEDSLGHGRYLLFYLLGGLAAGAAQVWAAWGSTIPTVGASGAIAAVMGAYLLMFPHARVRTLIPFFIFFRIVEVPATIFLGLWAWSQFYSGSLALKHTGLGGGVAWWAHVGGFLGGMILLGLFLPAKGKRRR